MANDNWGRAARIGVFIVGSEAVPEAEWWAMAPPGVSIHAARVSARAPWATWRDDRTGVEPAPDLARGAAQFAGMDLAAATLAHTSSSIVGGQGWDEAAVAALTPLLRPGTAVTTNGDDCVRALRHSGVTRPFIVWPPWFGDRAMAAGAAYFPAQGFPEISTWRQAPAPRWADVPPERMYAERMHMDQDADRLHDQILAECPASADGVLIAGTGQRCVGVIDRLEAALGRPVITANQAGLWRCLSLAGVDTPIEGYGALLAGPREAG